MRIHNIRSMTKPESFWTTYMVADLIEVSPRHVVEIIKRMKIAFMREGPHLARKIPVSEVNRIAAHYGVPEVCRYLMGLQKELPYWLAVNRDQYIAERMTGKP